MKEVKAVFHPSKREAVIEALRAIEGLPGVVCSDCHAHSLTVGDWAEVPRAKLEIMVSDDLVKHVVATIQRAAHTGNPGDGRIHVLPIEDSVLIRTGEHTGETR